MEIVIPKPEKSSGRVNLFKVAKAFGSKVTKYQIKYFEEIDPLNPENLVTGYICKQEGPIGGSILITAVNHFKVNQMVYGTPKLLYPYKDFDDFVIDVPPCHKYLFSNKWNGMNVLLFKYKDHEGKIFYSVKSKGVPFLKNAQFGNYLDLVKQFLGITENGEKIINIAQDFIKEFTLNGNIQSMSCELCGRKEPHLVKYDFDLDLIPLFITYEDGKISPFIKNSDIGSFLYDPQVLQQQCLELQGRDFERNEEYRRQNNLTHKYEYEHFITEGNVLYCLDEDGKVVDRKLYKVKPKDIEEVHWGNFDATMQGRIREALEKLNQRDKIVSEETIREELDMGDKEWGRYGKDVTNYISSLNIKDMPSLQNDKRRVLLLAGITGSGKTHVAKQLEERGWVLATGLHCATILREALTKETTRVIIEQKNILPKKRKIWIERARNCGVLVVEVLFLDYPLEVCKERLMKAQSTDEELSILQSQYKKKKKPRKNEGFTTIYVVQNDTQLLDTLNKLEGDYVKAENLEVEENDIDKKEEEEK